MHISKSILKFALTLFLSSALAACHPSPNSQAATLPPPPSPLPTPSGTVLSTSTPVTSNAANFSIPKPAELMPQEKPGSNGHPTLADLWDGHAQFVIEVLDTGLPMGESETIVMSNGEFWSYLHASDLSAGTIDRCGNAVPFPGCTVIYRSTDGGRTFQHDTPLVCQFECNQCPCDSENDHIDQQQYPRVAYDGQTLFLVYEYRGRVRMRRSHDGITWEPMEKFPRSTVWKRWWSQCYPEERIYEHPFVPYEYECLAGGPPGIYIEEGSVYVFMAMGQNPGSMGCYYGDATMNAPQFSRCKHNPLFVGASEYGPLNEKGPQTNPFFDFRTISSAEVQKVGERFYMLYEGVRGPGPGDYGDSQFALGLARSLTNQIDGPWETFLGNPILIDLPGNVGVGHADLVVRGGKTILYTSLDGKVRSRLALVWHPGDKGLP